ncbi:MAG: hypothetical protein AWM53_02057 [Candidatus Dichloromethanomonas elyunquensis]|nr:MAG: hypothetical protein AWM53_02057 [Candidatus Dichloromethanomonas elyunquensis]
MKRWLMYMQIHSMKNQGFSTRQVAEKLELNFRTVSKYLKMSPEEFNQTILNRERRRNLSLYENVVINWLKEISRYDRRPSIRLVKRTLSG